MDILSQFYKQVGTNKQAGWKICKSSSVEKVQGGWEEKYKNYKHAWVEKMIIE